MRHDENRYRAGEIYVWIVREGEDPYRIAPEVAGAIADEMLEPPDDKVCAFCSNKAPSAAVIAYYLHKLGTDLRNADIRTSSICEDCAWLTDEQLAEKTRQEVRAVEKRRAEIRAATQRLINSGDLVPTGETRRNPTTGELQPVYVAKKFAGKKPKR